jgi:hypothetical protein
MSKTLAPDSNVNETAKEPAKQQPSEKHVDYKKLKKDHPVSYWAFHLTNFVGLHFLFNSTVSLFIAYNLLPTKPAKAAKEFLGRISTPVNAAVSKLTTPIKEFFLGPNFKRLTEEEMAASVAHSARSRVETAFMCIAGFLALWPVKYLEDHRAEFMNFVDHLVHPGKSKEERKKTDLKPEEMPKETWSNLIRARFVGLGVVFGADALQQRFNNWRTYEKGNIDTSAWKWGAKISEKMPEGMRSWLVNFFSRKHIDIAHIQPEMRGHLLDAIQSPRELHNIHKQLSPLQEKMLKTTDKATLEGLEKNIGKINEQFTKSHPHLKPHIEKAIFAEQSRLLFTKEIFLTLLISTVIYVSAKAPFMAKFFEKVGLKKKEHNPDQVPTSLPESASQAVAEITQTSPKRSWASRQENQPKSSPAATTSFVEAALQKPHEPVVSV